MPYCSNCGTKLSDGANFCPNCGNAVGFRSQKIQQQESESLWGAFKRGWHEGEKPRNNTNGQNERIVYVQAPPQDIYVHARKSKGLAMTLCFFGGWFGLHEFYLRNYLSGTLYLLFFWTFIPLILSILDFIILFFTPKSTFHRIYDK